MHVKTEVDLRVQHIQRYQKYEDFQVLPVRIARVAISRPRRQNRLSVNLSDYTRLGGMRHQT